MKRKKSLYWIILIILLISIVGNAAFASFQQETTRTKQSSTLNGQFFLGDIVKIYVPSTYDSDQPIDNIIYVNLTLDKLSNLFGGATAIEGTGAWLTNDNKLIKEKVTIVYSYAKDLTAEQINEIVDYAKMIKEEMKQSSVTIEVNGKMYFIE